MKKRREKAGALLRFAYLAAVLAFIYLPVTTLVVFAFQATSVPVPPFDGPSLRWFSTVLADARMMRALGNSVLVAFTSSAIATVCGTLAAYAIARHGGRWARLLQGVFMLPLTISYVVIGMGLLITMMWLRMPKSLTAVILGHAVVNMPIVVALVASQMQRGMLNLERAARDLGASELRVVRHIVVPSLAMPIIAAFLLCLTMSWDEFIIALLLSRIDVTLPVEIWSQLRSGLNPKTNAVGAIVFFVSAMIVIAAGWLLSTTSRLRKDP